MNRYRILRIALIMSILYPLSLFAQEVTQPPQSSIGEQNGDINDGSIRKSAEQGNAYAQFVMGMNYLQGKGVSQDNAEAAKWFQKSAQKGNPSAQCMLGTIYATGLGVERDPIQAYMWLTLSIDGSAGNQTPFLQKATELRNTVIKNMIPQQIEEARNLVKEWDLKNPLRKGTNGYYPAEFSEPVLLDNVMPRYTAQAREARKEGSVVLNCIIRKAGTVDSCKILRGLGYGLDESAIKTVETKWRFEPATNKGEPVDLQVFLEVTFRIF